MVWRKIDNFTAFTDGGTSWVNGPNGLQSRLNSARFSWEKDPGTARPSSVQERHLWSRLLLSHLLQRSRLQPPRATATPRPAPTSTPMPAPLQFNRPDLTPLSCPGA